MNNKNQELKNKIRLWWSGLRRLQKIDILIEIFDVSIETIERQGLHTLWNGLTLEKQKLIMEIWEKEQGKGRR